MQSLTVAIMPTGKLDVAKIDKMQINIELKKFKNENNSINYPALFDIPKEQRIAAMAKKDLGGTIKVITVALTLAFETMNLVRSMNAFQILDLSEAIVDESPSDNLAVEDLMLFLQKLTRGEYPELYEGIDQAKFMSRFNSYRDERWTQGIKLRDEKHEEYKRLGDDNFHERSNRTSPIDEELVKHRQKFQEKKDELALVKKENEILKQQRDF